MTIDNRILRQCATQMSSDELAQLLGDVFAPGTLDKALNVAMTRIAQSEPIYIHIWVDGWCRGNGTPEARAGWSVQEQTAAGSILHFQGGRVSASLPQTNNVAEYMAIIDGLRLALNERMPYAQFIIHTDSALVVGQVTKGWKVRVDHLKPLVKKAQALAKETGATIVKEPREKIVEVLGH